MAIKGTTRNGVEINLLADKDGFTQTRAVTQLEMEHSSARGLAFVWTSTDSDIDAGDTRLFIKNTGDKFLKLSYALFTSSNVACKWVVGIGSETTTPTGTVVTARNLNQNFTTTEESYLAFDDETAVADANVLFRVATPVALDTRIIPLTGFVLGKNHYIQINQSTESTSGSVAIFGSFTTELV